jgi:DNA (cytosine-5)-methyltransferase 3A
MTPINVLSLFDGMSCGQISLKELGYDISNYYYSEIDKHAIKQTQHNFPNAIHVGDVTKWKEWDIDWSSIDLLLAGSPCQGFSFAGKQLAFDDPRSALFFVFVEIWNHIKSVNPNAHYLLENVKMKREHEIVISKYLGVAPIEINSALVSAQNRVRLYWTNIANEPYGLFGDMECTISQPKDRGILLKDILESDVDEKYYLSEKMLKFFAKHNANNKEKGNGFLFKPKDNSEKANCVNARYHKMGADDTYIVASRGRNPENPKSRQAGLNTEQMLEPRFDGKTNCLTSVQKDNLVMQVNPSKESGGKQPYQQNRVYDSQGISPALCANKADLLIKKNYQIRRLTPTECARLQTIPSWYEWISSDTQIYRMLGNGWTVEVIKHILSYLHK